MESLAGEIELRFRLASTATGTRRSAYSVRTPTAPRGRVQSEPYEQPARTRCGAVRAHGVRNGPLGGTEL